MAGAAGSRRTGHFCELRTVAIITHSYFGAGTASGAEGLHDLAANDATTDLLINVITAVGQFQRDIQNELTVEGIAAAEAEGRYRGRPSALTGADLEDVRSTYTEQGASIAALARAHGVSRAAIRTALADLMPGRTVPAPRSF